MSLDQAAATYREEALELLNEVEATLLELEIVPDHPDNLAKLFRAMHTIKGSGAMFGFDEISRFTHEVETVLDKVRSGELPLDARLLGLTLRAKDHILVLLSSSSADTEVTRASDTLIEELRACLGESAGPEPGPAMAGEPGTPKGPDVPAEPAGPRPLDPTRTALWWVRYRPAVDTLLTGTNPLALLAELDDLGRVSPALRLAGLPRLDALDPEGLFLWWDILVASDAGENALRDVFVFVEEEAGLAIHKLADCAMRAVDVVDFLARMETAPPGTEAGLASRLADLATSRLAGRRRGPPAETTPAAKKEVAQGPSSIRVDSGRLDKLVDLVGELVITQARLSQTAGSRVDPGLRAIAEELERITALMRDEALGIRMVPIGTIYASLRRLVRDLAEDLGKSVEFIGEGAETELDKNVIDHLKDPLVHILRNAVDHGLESPQAREAAGKPERGTIRLAASHAGGEVVIRIHDDGAGIDLEAVRRKAVDRGLLAPTEEVDDERLLGMIFAPGFSTAKAVTNVSGRGVGMDVVKRNLESLRGSVGLKTKAGQGTDLTIRLPLTLAIIDGLLVRVGRELYIIPLDIAEACQERFVGETLPLVTTIERREKLIPCVSLRQLLAVPGEQPAYERIIVTRVEGREVGLAVDAVIGQQQAVIKRLSTACSTVSWISGTTVNGDGGISLILDVARIVRHVQDRAHSA